MAKNPHKQFEGVRLREKFISLRTRKKTFLCKNTDKFIFMKKTWPLLDLGEAILNLKIVHINNIFIVLKPRLLHPTRRLGFIDKIIGGRSVTTLKSETTNCQRFNNYSLSGISIYITLLMGCNDFNANLRTFSKLTSSTLYDLCRSVEEEMWAFWRSFLLLREKFVLHFLVSRVKLCTSDHHAIRDHTPDALEM